jgi:hypothetical protein
MAPRITTTTAKTYSREHVDLLLDGVRAAHAATNTLITEKMGSLQTAINGIAVTQAETKRDLEHRAEQLELTDDKLSERQNRLDRKVYWMLGLIAAMEVLGTAFCSSGGVLRK